MSPRLAPSRLARCFEPGCGKTMARPESGIAIVGDATTDRFIPSQAGSKSRLAMQALACYLRRAAAMTSREVMRRLETAGWRLKKVKGSHHHFTHPTRSGKVTVKHPARDFPIGTLKSIERQSGVSLTLSAR